MCAILAVICIPWMLLTKPLYLLFQRHRMRRQVCVFTRFIFLCPGHIIFFNFSSSARNYVVKKYYSGPVVQMPISVEIHKLKKWVYLNFNLGLAL